MAIGGASVQDNACERTVRSAEIAAEGQLANSGTSGFEGGLIHRRDP